MSRNWPISWGTGVRSRSTQEMDLVNVKFVVFLGPVLNGPVFDRALWVVMAGGLSNRRVSVSHRRP